jgi:hypothetical protein
MNVGAYVGHVNVSLAIVIKTVRTTLVPKLSVAVTVTAVCTRGFVGVPTRYTVCPLDALSESPYADVDKDSAQEVIDLFAEDEAEKVIGSICFDTM